MQLGGRSSWCIDERELDPWLYGEDEWRQTGNLMLAQQLLRHESVATTQAYLHPTRRISPTRWVSCKCCVRPRRNTKARAKPKPERTITGVMSS